MLKLLIVVGAATALGGCASIMHGSSQDIYLDSVPPGALAHITGHGNYITPATVKLSRKQGWLVTVSKEGYESDQVRIRQTLSGAAVGNVLAGGPIGFFIDTISGAANTLTPDKIMVTLVPSQAPAATDPLAVLEQAHQQGKITQAEFEARKAILDKMPKQISATELVTR